MNLLRQSGSVVSELAPRARVRADWPRATAAASRPSATIRLMRQVRVGNKTARCRCSFSLALILSASPSPCQSKTEHRRHCRRPPSCLLAATIAPLFDSSGTQLRHASLHLADPLASPFKPRYSCSSSSPSSCPHRSAIELSLTMAMLH